MECWGRLVFCITLVFAIRAIWFICGIKLLLKTSLIIFENNWTSLLRFSVLFGRVTRVRNFSIRILLRPFLNILQVALGCWNLNHLTFNFIVCLLIVLSRLTLLILRLFLLFQNILLIKLINWLMKLWRVSLGNWL